MTQTRKSIAMVYAIDQMLDYFELAGKPLPDVVSIDKETYEALGKFVGDAKLTRYRKVRLNIVKKNSKT